jgi:ParB-like chromosome segregation protein Spo0J
MNFENRPTHSLRPYPGNARTHSPKQIKQISRSIERFGFNNPGLVDDDDQIIAGHGRVEAAKLLNMKTVPTVRLSHLSDDEKRAYILADNRLAEKAGWDNDILAIELQGLVDIGFDVLLTGFEPAEVDIIIERSWRRKRAAGKRCARADGRAADQPVGRCLDARKAYPGLWRFHGYGDLQDADGRQQG